jgi:uncharacterized membrane protein
VVSLATFLLMPESRILFGVLTCIGSCMLLMIPMEKLLRKLPACIGALASLALFALLRNCNSGTLGFETLILCRLPNQLYRNHLTAYLGFPHRGFFSTDYFSLLPWLFLFLTGYFLFRITTTKGWNIKLFARGRVPLLNWMGRHSLLVYLLHQPVLYGLGMLYFYLLK